MLSLNRRDFLATAGAAGIAAPFAKLLAEPLQAPSQAAGPAVPAGPYEVMVIRDVMVPMRDGVKMATDIYLPSRGGSPLPGPFPTLLSRTPYGKAGVGGVAN